MGLGPTRCPRTRDTAPPPPFALLAPPLLHGAVDLLRGGERIRRVHPLITVFASELCGHQDAALALQELRRHFGTEIVAVPVPVHALIATVGECLHGPQWS